MALAPCPECQTKISDEADICPNCRKPDPFKLNRKKAIRAMLFGLVVVFAAGGYLFYSVIPDIKQNGLFPKSQHK